MALPVIRARVEEGNEGPFRHLAVRACGSPRFSSRSRHPGETAPTGAVFDSSVTSSSTNADAGLERSSVHVPICTTRPTSIPSVPSLPTMPAWSMRCSCASLERASVAIDRLARTTMSKLNATPTSTRDSAPHGRGSGLGPRNLRDAYPGEAPRPKRQAPDADAEGFPLRAGWSTVRSTARFPCSGFERRSSPSARLHSPSSGAPLLGSTWRFRRSHATKKWIRSGVGARILGFQDCVIQAISARQRIRPWCRVRSPRDEAHQGSHRSPRISKWPVTSRSSSRYRSALRS